MIIIYTGGIGSGKTLSVVKEIVDRNQITFTNFDIENVDYTRLKQEHLFESVDEGKSKKLKLNFEFWKNQVKKGKGFDVYLDEFHNVMNSRRAMSKQNVLMSDWLSQIRKILGESETNNLYVISQKLRRIDVNCRDLAQSCIRCEKQEIKTVKIPTEVVENGKLTVKKLPLVIIYKNYYKDADALSAEENFGVNTCIGKTRFVANPYYKFYNSYELIDFGSDEYI